MMHGFELILELAGRAIWAVMALFALIVVIIGRFLTWLLMR